MAVFHSISAFCNAGFDLMGTHSGAFSSLTAYSRNVAVILPISLLIVFGGIGFLTWHDIVTLRKNVRRYMMQSKVILVTTAVLIAIPAIMYFLCEFTDSSLPERISLSLFQAVTPRTAGFNTADLTKMTGAGIGLMILLMIVGGSPGSTAGGMKTTTLTVLVASAVSVFRRKKDTQLFGKRVEDSVIRNASALLLIYLFLTLACGMVISLVEGLPMKACLFETASAVGTVGLTLGITPSLGLFSHIILILLMFLGRVGGLTLMYAAISDRKAEVSRRPVEKINVG
jgi:trk system potassium uptake protein TrkH